MTAKAWSDEAARQAAQSFDLAHLPPGFLDDPYPYYHALRRFDPVHRMPDGSLLLTRYADVVAVYKDRRFSSDKKIEFKPKFGDGWLYVHHTSSLVFNDPPLHTRVRRLIMGGLNPRALSALEPMLVALVDRLLDAAAARGGMDVIEDFASAIPIQVIGDLLGVPQADRGPLRGWSLLILGALEPVLTAEQLAAGNKAVADFRNYLIELVADRRRNLRDLDSDMLSRLIVGEADGERLTEEELLQNCIFLLNAGHETTTNLIGNGIAALLENPQELARLRADPTLIKSAVEEFLRYESSNQLGNRRAAEAVEIAGQSYPEGTLITLGIGAANRDPEEFPDPDRLDITRAPNRHLAFGSGMHACAGMTLARLEGQLAIGRLLARFPKIERAGAFKRGGRARFRGFLSYPVTFK
ncbi:MAG: cytochrome P450 [Proteobacteria bacterium]|nr:MAG: cytochrome P450 [Pseudomonadota bacterium]